MGQTERSPVFPAVEDSHGLGAFVYADKDGGGSGKEGGDRAQGDLERAVFRDERAECDESLEFGGSSVEEARGKNGEMGVRARGIRAKFPAGVSLQTVERGL